MPITFSTFQNEYRLTAELLLPQTREEVFSFFSDAKNLEQITPPFLKFGVQNSSEVCMKVDTVINYRMQLHGIPIRWRTLISLWNPPHEFVDEQLRGPYRYWIHHHSFEQRGNQTLVRDFVRYQVFGGKLVHELVVKRDLKTIFSYREKTLRSHFGPQVNISHQL